MNDALKRFFIEIEQLREIWAVFAVSCVAVCDSEGRWYALATRIRLCADHQLPAEFTLSDTGVTAFRLLIPSQNFNEYVENALSKEFLLTRDGKTINLRHEEDRRNSTAISFHFCSIQKPSFKSSGSSEFSISITTNPSRTYMFISSDQVERISSALRARTDFRDLGDLIASLGVPYDPKSQNESRLVVDAVVPLELRSEGARALEFRMPVKVAQNSRLKAFFDTEPRGATMTVVASGERLDAEISWPEHAVDAVAHLFWNDVELASVELKRWPGVRNWRLMVDRFFAETSEALESVIVERKDSDRFELGISRLLAALDMPAPWYGQKNIHGKPDIAAWMSIEGEWIVLLGECTGQRPSDKFTLLLTRARQLSELLQNQATILPVVFTSMEISEVDRIQATRDNIVLVGRSELHTLLSMAKVSSSPKDVISYLRGLMSHRADCSPFDFLPI